MNPFTILLLLAASALLPACQSNHEALSAQHAAQSTGDVQTIAFRHQDAAQAANHARAEFGVPPMDGVVQVAVDSRTNSWIVKASAADMKRVEATAARLDQPTAGAVK